MGDELTQSFIVTQMAWISRVPFQAEWRMIPGGQKELGLKDEESAKKAVFYFPNTFDFTSMGARGEKAAQGAASPPIGFY